MGSEFTNIRFTRGKIWIHWDRCLLLSAKTSPHPVLMKNSRSTSVENKQNPGHYERSRLRATQSEERQSFKALAAPSRSSPPQPFASNLAVCSDRRKTFLSDFITDTLPTSCNTMPFPPTLSLQYSVLMHPHLLGVEYRHRHRLLPHHYVERTPRN